MRTETHAGPSPAALDGVSKRFGSSVALAGVSFVLAEGEIAALLGPNGAGKTTALNVLLGLRRPDRGRALLFGRDPRDPAARRLVGTTPQITGLPPYLRVSEVLDFARAHYPSPAPRGETCERFGLLGLEKRQTGGLSGGEQRRLAIALAFAGNPRAVLLDEPTTGLDVASRHALWEAIRSYAAGGGTVLLTTHYLQEAEALADRVTLLVEGRVVAEGAPGAVAAQAGLLDLESAYLAITGEAR